jgi:hypothetical protein
MAIGAATDWKVVVNNVNLSSWAHNVSIDDTREKLDASTFNPNNNKTYIPGQRDQTVTIQFRNDRASGGPFQTILPLYTGGSAFPFFVQGDSDAGTSSTNQIFGGTASCYGFPLEASLNEIEELEIEFSPASNSVFNWGTVAP